MEKYSMQRSKIHMENRQIRVFNGRGWVNPQQYSIGNFLEPNFAEFHSFYRFGMDILERKSNTKIWTDIDATWDEWVNKGEGTDPLGSNFRKNFKFLVVPREEEWRPGHYEWQAIFNKKIKNIDINIFLKCTMTVSHIENKVLYKWEIHNKGKSNLILEFLPRHNSTRDGHKIQQLNPNLGKLENKKKAVFNSTIINSNQEHVLEINKNKCVNFYSELNFIDEEDNVKEVNPKKSFNDAMKNAHDRVIWLEEKMPKFSTKNQDLQSLYYKSLITLNECRWVRSDFVVNPFWSVGSWIFTIAWDTQFSRKTIGILNPQSLLDATWLPFTHGKMNKSYVDWQKIQKTSGEDIFYMQEPYSVICLLKTYLDFTGDVQSLKIEKDGFNLIDNFKKWGKTYISFLNDDHLIDINDETELIVEIRTKGYDHIIPNVNIIVAEYFNILANLCKMVNDSDEKKYRKLAQNIMNSVVNNLWDEKDNWFSNLYSDGTKKNIYAYHLFDSLESELLPDIYKYKLLTHMNEHEFLSTFGTYSIAKRDVEHFDWIDADWGGGGQFAGMPGKIALNSFRLGMNSIGFDIINKVARWTKYFPYQPQNARAENPSIDLSSMAIQLAAGASCDAIIFGVFGIILNDKEIIIKPALHESLKGYAELTNIKLRGKVFSVKMYERNFLIVLNNKKYIYNYGESHKIKTVF